MTFLTRDALLQHRPTRYEDVPVPELATEQDPHPTVRIKALSASEVDRFLGSLFVDGKYQRQDYVAKLLVAAMVNEALEPTFTVADIPAVGQFDSAMAQRLTVVAERLAGMEAKQLRSAKGN